MEDTELKGRFDTMEVKLAANDGRFDALDAKLAANDRRFDTIDARFDQVDTRFAEVDVRFDKVDARFGEVDARFDKVDARFGEVDARFDKMERLILQEGERTRRHFDVMAEGLKDEIRLSRDGYIALREDNTEIKNRLERVETGQDRLEVRMLAVESRVNGVEKTQKVVLTEVRGLATKVDRLRPVRNKL
jgi:chromosome segregation ATPase